MKYKLTVLLHQPRDFIFKPFDISANIYRSYSLTSVTFRFPFSARFQLPFEMVG